MDSARLITIVQEYEELYNLRHSEYSNQQRRDNIWEEIGKRMNQPSATCKSQWTRIRDNHRKALNLRKTKSDQAASKMKPPKYHMELQFLAPYLSDDDDRLSNVTSSTTQERSNVEEEEIVDDHEQAPTTIPILSTAPLTSETQRSSSAAANTNARQKRVSGSSDQQTTAAAVLEKYLNSHENSSTTKNPPPDSLTEFFVYMARTVKTFPLQDQIRIKGQLFQMLNSVEMRLAQEKGPSTSFETIADTFGCSNENIL